MKPEKFRINRRLWRNQAAGSRYRFTLEQAGGHGRRCFNVLSQYAGQIWSTLPGTPALFLQKNYLGVGHLSRAASGPKFNILLTRSFVPRPVEYSRRISSTLAQRSRSLRVLKMLTLHGWTNWRTFDWFYKSSRHRQLTRGQSNLTKSASRGAHSPVRGHPRGSKFVPLNSWGMGSYSCSIVTIGLGCTVWPQCTRVTTNQRPTTSRHSLSQ